MVRAVRVVVVSVVHMVAKAKDHHDCPFDGSGSGQERRRVDLRLSRLSPLNHEPGWIRFGK